MEVAANFTQPVPVWYGFAPRSPIGPVPYAVITGPVQVQYRTGTGPIWIFQSGPVLGQYRAGIDLYLRAGTGPV